MNGLCIHLLYFFIASFYLVESIKDSLSQHLVYQGYRPSKQELEWIKNVHTWQDDVCMHLPRTIIDSYISTVKQFNTLDQKSVIAYISNQNNKNDFSDSLSHHDYSYFNHSSNS